MAEAETPNTSASSRQHDQQELQNIVEENGSKTPPDLTLVEEPGPKAGTTNPPISNLKTTIAGSSKTGSQPIPSTNPIVSTLPSNILHTQLKRDSGETFAVLRFKDTPTRLEAKSYRSLKAEHIVLEELNPNVNFEDVILSPIKLQSLIIEAVVPADFIFKVFKQCTSIKTFKLLGQIDGNLLRPNSMASFIEESFPNLQEFEIDIGSVYRYLASETIPINIYEKWTRDSMALMKSTNPWAPKLENLKFNSVITRQWNPYQTLLRLLGFMKLHSKSLKKLELALASVTPNDQDFDEHLTNLETQHVESILNELIVKKKFSKLKDLGMDLSTRELTHWLKLLLAQRHLESVTLKMSNSSFKWAQISDVIGNNFQTLKEIKVTCDLSPKFDFSIIRRCSSLIKVCIRHNPDPIDFMNRRASVENLDLGHHGMPRFESVTLIGFEMKHVEIERMTDNCSSNVKLTTLAIHSGRSGSPVDTLAFGTRDFDCGFTRESFKKLLGIRTLDGLLMGYDQFHFNSIFQKACLSNFVGSFAEDKPHQMFEIGRC